MNVRNYKTVCDFFENSHGRTTYLSILDTLGGTLVERIYAYRYRKSEKHPVVKEIFRINMSTGKMKVSDDLYISTMAGYITIFETRDCGYYRYKPTNKMNDIRQMINISFFRHFENYEKVLKRDPKYAEYLCSYNRGYKKARGLLYHYHQHLQEYPSMEYFLKLGLTKLASDTRALKKAQKEGAFRKYLVDNRKVIAERYCNYPQILRCYKSGNSIKDAYILDNIASIIDLDNKPLVKKVVDYLKDKDVLHYVDCIEMQKKLGRVIDFFPKELDRLHDELHLEILEKEDQAVAALLRMKSQFKKTRIGKLQFVPLKTIDDFKQEGAAMNHCVYSMKFYKKEESLIMSVRDQDWNRIETIEIDLDKLQLIQSRGHSDQPTKYHGEIIELVNKKLLPRIKKMKTAEAV